MVKNTVGRDIPQHIVDHTVLMEKNLNTAHNMKRLSVKSILLN